MSDTPSNFGRPVRVVDLKLNVNINLPADAPDRCPHLIRIEDVDYTNENQEPINTPNVVVSVLYKWDIRALGDLLDLTKDTFQWGFNTYSVDTYVKRHGRKITVLVINRESCKKEEVFNRL